MTLKHNEHRCLCLSTVPDDEWLDGLHFRKPSEAAEAASHAPKGVKVTTTLLDVPCVFLVCDHCEEEAEDDGRGLHFLSVEEATKWALQNRWTTDGLRFGCDDCSGDLEPKGRMPVLPDQIPLGGEV